MDGKRREPRQAGACVDHNGNNARYQQQHAVEDQHAEHPFFDRWLDPQQSPLDNSGLISRWNNDQRHLRLSS